MSDKSNKFVRSKLLEHSGKITSLYFFTIVLAFSTLFLGILSGPAIKMFFNSSGPKTAETILDPEILKVFHVFGVTFEPRHMEIIFVNLPFIVLGIALVRFLTQAYVYAGWEWIGEHIGTNTRKSLTDGYIGLSTKAKVLQKTKDIENSLATIVTNEVYTLKYYIVRFFGGVPREVVQSIFLGISLFVISYKLTLIFLFVIVVLGAILKKISKKIKKRTREEFDQQNELAEWVQQRISGMETIKHYGSEDYESGSMANFSENLLGKQIKTTKTAARTAPISEALSVLGVAAIFYYANRYRADLGLSGSTLMSYFSTLAFLSQSINKASKYTNIFSRGKASLEKILDTLNFLNQNQERPISHDFRGNPDGKSAITLKDISYKYTNSSETVLENISYKFEYGKMYAIAGESGAGKSTLINLILGALTPEKGSVSLFETKAKPNEIVYMPQILEGSYLTLGQTISFPQISFDRKKALAALEKANLTDALKEKNIDLDFTLGFGSAQLSGGEWQRLNLARVFYHDSAIIIADESTSALDPKTEAKVLDEMKSLAKSGSCVITIAHRPSVINACDEVMTLGVN